MQKKLKQKIQIQQPSTSTQIISVEDSVLSTLSDNNELSSSQSAIKIKSSRKRIWYGGTVRDTETTDIDNVNERKAEVDDEEDINQKNSMNVIWDESKTMDQMAQTPGILHRFESWVKMNENNAKSTMIKGGAM